MNLIKKYLNRETITYMIFGVLTTVVNFLVFTPLYEMGLETTIANAIAWFAAVTFSYLANRIFVFKSNIRYIPGLIREILLFFAARLLSLGVETIGLKIAEYIGINAYIAKIILAVFVVVLNYVLSKLVIFKKKENHEHEPN